MYPPTRRIPCLVPDLPTTADLVPYLEQIDAARWYSNFGPLATTFEDRLKQSFGSSVEVVSCSSGTAALEAGLAAYGLPQGTRVLLPALTFPATAQAVLRAGFEPVFADVSPDSWQLTPSIARDGVEHHDIGLVMPVATFGLPVPTAAWDEFTAQRNIPVLIDAAPAFGRQAVGQTTSVAFSFHATKPFGIGEGGAFVTPSAFAAARARSFTNFGFLGNAVHAVGINGKLSEYHAAVGLAQLDRWPALVERRQHIWDEYVRRLAVMPEIVLQRSTDSNALALLVVRVPFDATAIVDRLEERRIHTRRWYVPPLHRHPAFEQHRRAGPLTQVDTIAPQLVGLPFHTSLDVKDIALVCRTLGHAVARAGCPERIAS